MQKLLRKVGGRIFFVSHRQTHNYLWSRDVIVSFQINITLSPLILGPPQSALFIHDFCKPNLLCIAYVPLVAAISPSNPTQPTSTLRLLVHRDVRAASTGTALTKRLQLDLTAVDTINLTNVPSQSPP